jgi:lipoprotein-anchoring transpeptidase ErfK/SrfK
MPAAPMAGVACAAVLLGCGDAKTTSAGPAPERSPAPAPRTQELPFAHVGARVLRRTALRAAPRRRARVLGHARRRTEFGNATVLHVSQNRGRWIRVLHQSLRNHERAWVAARDVQLVREPWAIEVDLSARRAVVRLHGKVIDRFHVGVGRTGHDTPTGTYAITDLIRTTGRHSPYGCCVLALTGHQPSLPSGWIGGDRIALHGTPDESTIGAARSAGCLRVREDDLRKLMRRVRLGTRVTIRA